MLKTGAKVKCNETNVKKRVLTTTKEKKNNKYKRKGE